MDDMLLPMDYTLTNYELSSAYFILIIVPFLSFIIVQGCIIYNFIR
jgi:hypothetical protein